MLKFSKTVNYYCSYEIKISCVEFLHFAVTRPGVAGDIITRILDCGFEISALMQVTMERANAEEFYEVYKGVVNEYPQMVSELCCGPCIAMEVRARDAAKTFREFVGPADPVR